MPAVLQPAEQHLVGEWRLDRLLDHTRHRPCSHHLIIAVLDEPGARFVAELDTDVAVGELGFELHDEFVDDFGDEVRRQMAESHDRIEPVAEFRREQAVDRLHVVAFPLGAGEAIGGLAAMIWPAMASRLSGVTSRGTRRKPSLAKARPKRSTSIPKVSRSRP